jgi:hypothetical protein
MICKIGLISEGLEQSIEDNIYERVGKRFSTDKDGTWTASIAVTSVTDGQPPAGKYSKRVSSTYIRTL